jgi:hypothetical protein
VSPASQEIWIDEALQVGMQMGLGRANGNAVIPDRLYSASGRAIKRISGWREGLPPTVAVKFRSEGGLHPPGKVSLERKKTTALIC